MGREMGEGFRREGTYIYLWLIHVDVWQKPTQYCRLSSNKKKIKERMGRNTSKSQAVKSYSHKLLPNIYLRELSNSRSRVNFKRAREF